MIRIITMLLCVASFCVMGQDHRADYVWGTGATYSVNKRQDINGSPSFAYLSTVSIYGCRKLFSFSLDKQNTSTSNVIREKRSEISGDIGLSYYLTQNLYSHLFEPGTYKRFERSLRPVFMINYTNKMSSFQLNTSLYLVKDDIVRLTKYWTYSNAGLRVKMGFPVKQNLILPGIGVEYGLATKYIYPHVLLEFRFGSGWAL